MIRQCAWQMNTYDHACFSGTSDAVLASAGGIIRLDEGRELPQATATGTMYPADAPTPIIFEGWGQIKSGK